MKLETVLQEWKIPYEKKVHHTTYTSQELAAAEHVSGYNVAKPVLVKGKHGFAMCVLSACDRLDLARAARALHEEQLQLATERETRSLFPDCEPGAEPPVGRLFNMTTIMDERLSQDDFLVMQSGSHNEAVKVQRADWERLCEPIIKARIAQ